MQFGKWAAQVERDFKDFEEKMTIEEINRELENAHKQIVEHFEAVGEYLQQWDVENRKVTELILSKLTLFSENRGRSEEHRGDDETRATKVFSRIL